MIEGIIPIIRVPTNIASEIFEHALGPLAYPKQTLHAISKALSEQLEEISPDEADTVMRALKKGTLGGAALALGYFAHKSFGGFYQQGEKPNKALPKYGEIRVEGKELPDTILHSPFLSTMQVGAMARNVAESRIGGKEQGIPAGVMAAMLGVVENVPLVDEVTSLNKLLTPRERGMWIDQTVKNMVEPQFVQWAAKFTDKDKDGNTIIRDPKGFAQVMEIGLPGYREKVPIKK
jgi:hypothetical protein